MFTLFKSAFLFLSILFILPLVFFLLVGSCGRLFSLTIDRDSWVARTNVRWIRSLLGRFMV